MNADIVLSRHIKFVNRYSAAVTYVSLKNVFIFVHRLCGLVVRVHGCGPRGIGLDFLGSSGYGTESTQTHEDK
jgi:hypothetical protein